MRIKQQLAIAAIVAALCAGAGDLFAQNSAAAGTAAADPAQQRYMNRVQAGLGYSNEADWNAIQPLVQQVFEAQRDLSISTGRSGVSATNAVFASTNSIAAGVRTVRAGRPIVLGQPTPEAQALQNAINDNASDAQIDAALQAYEAAQKTKRDKLVQAQENLRKTLTKKQEAQATLMHVLD